MPTKTQYINHVRFIDRVINPLGIPFTNTRIRNGCKMSSSASLELLSCATGIRQLCRAIAS